MTTERFAAWVIFALFCVGISLSFQPFANEYSVLEARGEDFSAFNLHFSRTIQIVASIGALSIFFALVKRYKFLGYPIWMALSSLIVGTSLFIGPLFVDWFDVWQGVDTSVLYEAKSANEAIVMYIVVGTLFVSVLFGLFSKARPE